MTHKGYLGGVERVAGGWPGGLYSDRLALERVDSGVNGI